MFSKIVAATIFGILLLLVSVRLVEAVRDRYLLRPSKEPHNLGKTIPWLDRQFGQVMDLIRKDCGEVCNTTIAPTSGYETTFGSDLSFSLDQYDSR